MSTFFKVAGGVVLLGAVAGITGANFQRDPTLFQFKWKINQEVPLQVKLDAVDRGKVVQTIEAPGEVDADVEVEISAQVLGRIVSLPVREGDTVKKGDVLVKLDSVDFEAQVRSAQARVARLESSIELTDADIRKSERDVERSRKLFEQKAIGSTELSDLETVLAKDKARLAMSKSELAETEAALAVAKENLADTVIRSPIEGIVSQLIAEEGEVVVVGTMNNAGTIIMVVSDPNTMVVRASIDENDVPLVKKGQKAVIHLQYDEETTLSGSVLRISPKGLKGNRNNPMAAGNTTNPNEVATFETIITIDSPPEQVKLGMSANVDVQVDQRDDALRIPTQAVLHRRAADLPPDLKRRIESNNRASENPLDTSRRYYQVVLVDVGGKAQYRLVKTGISDEEYVEITDGLEEGEKVISGPYRVFEKLKEGSAIKLLEESAAAKP